MLLTSLKPSDQVHRDPYAVWPNPFDWGNFNEAVERMPVLTQLGNSTLLCVGSVIGTVLSCSLAAYGFSKLRWPGRDLVFALVIATLALPFHVTMIPRFAVIRWLGLYDSLWALIVPTFCGNAFFIFLLRQFFRTIPDELCEAARIDGCGEWGIFWRIVVPLSRPALATVALFQFLESWNDFSGPLLYLNDPAKYPLAYGLQQFIGAYRTDWSLLMAAATIFILPVAMLFFLTQRTFIRGITLTGIKG
jgi:multiple sugar transport system permease protein